MAFLPGLKKQLNKANQYMSERITGVEGTKMDDEFTGMEQQTDVFAEMVDDLQLKTKEYLQPNPNVRVKMSAVRGISKLSGQAKASTYPQPEGLLADSLLTHGKKLQDFRSTDDLASAMNDFGDSLRQMADLKYSLDDSVKQNFLDPLHHSQTKDIKEVMHHRKKLTGRKLDFDCKKRKGATEEEIRAAEEKFSESLNLAQVGMHNLLNDGACVEQISQLTQFSEALLEYHKNCTSILQNLTEKLYETTNEAGSKPKSDFKPKTLEDLGVVRSDSGDRLKAYSNDSRKLSSNSRGGSPAISPTHQQSGGNKTDVWGDGSSNTNGQSSWSTGKSSAASAPASGGNNNPSCKAIYDFQAESEGELSFKEGEIIQLKAKIDDNWFSGSVRGKSGYFPVNYVNVITPLPFT